ncbi:MAG: hypothetical protein H5T78_08760 [Nocardia sp.]|nr:hypothetical protein [Nocardia sp.]
MPRENRALTRAVRARAAQRDLPYQQAREEVLVIRNRAGQDGVTFAEAEAEFDDPLNQLLCEKCSWTVGMVCPECPGCGCYNFVCSGWRHHEYMHEDDLADFHACDDCGGDTRNGYDCRCGWDE